MKGIIYFDICGLIILVGLITIFYVRKNTSCIRNTIYKLILWTILISTALSILNTSLQNEMIYIKNVSELLKVLYYIVHTSIPLIFCSYFIVFIDDYKNIGKVKMGFFLVPMIFMLLAIFTTPFTQWLFYFDQDGQYRMGKFFYFSYFITSYYYITIFTYLTINRKKYKKLISTTFYLSLIFVIIPIVLQNFFRGYLLENFAATICALILYITIESVETLIDSNTGMFTQDALINKISTYYNSNTAFEAVVIKTADLELIIDKMGLELVNTLFREIADYLKTLKPTKAYYLSNECFVLIYEKFEMVDNIIEEIQVRMRNSWYIGELDIKVSEYICRISVPKHADNKEVFLDYISYIQNIKKHDNNLIKVNEINLQGRKRRIKIENAIKYALEHDTFEVYYQPIYSIEKQRIVSAEALLRLSDPELGFIPPNEIISIAEMNSSILKIGHIVFDKVCHFISTNDLAPKGIEFIEINLSVIQCMHAELVSEFKEIIDFYKVDPKQICLEITETATENTPEMLSKNIDEFRSLGIEFALDDYGTGYSNLHKVVNLPFAFVKYDKEMIWSALSNPRAKMAVGLSMNLIRELGMKVIAEGIETIEQLEDLRNMNCDYIQGYYFSKPVPKAEFIQFINEKVEFV